MDSLHNKCCPSGLVWSTVKNACACPEGQTLNNDNTCVLIQTETKSGLSTGAKIGIIVPAVLVGLAAAIGLIAYICRSTKPPEDVGSSVLTAQALEI